MSSWLGPSTRWQALDESEDVVGRLTASGTLLVTWPPGPEESTPTHCFRLGRQYWIWQPGVGGVQFTADEPALVLHPLIHTDRAWFERLVSRSWLPAVYPIWQRQVLHASAVAGPSGRVIAFTGPSGAGKSTLAYGMSRRTEWTLVADDTLAFSLSGQVGDQHITLHPLRSESRLRQATAEYFGKPDATEVSFAWPSQALLLAGIYVLDAGDGGGCAFATTRLSVTEAYPLLLAQAHALSLSDPEHNQRLMRDYLALAADVPVYRLTYPRSFSGFEAVLAALDSHASTHARRGCAPRVRDLMPEARGAVQ